MRARFTAKVEGVCTLIEQKRKGSSVSPSESSTIMNLLAARGRCESPSQWRCVNTARRRTVRDLLVAIGTSDELVPSRSVDFHRITEQFMSQLHSSCHVCNIGEQQAPTDAVPHPSPRRRH